MSNNPSIKMFLLYRNIYFVLAVLSQLSCIILMIIEKNYFYFSNSSVYFFCIYGAVCHKYYKKCLNNELLISRNSANWGIIIAVFLVLFYGAFLYLFFRSTKPIPVDIYYTIVNTAIINPIILILGTIGFLFILLSMKREIISNPL